LPRRDLSDIRVQLMAEDEAANDETLNDIEDSDIRTGVYEGGFKTWECSIDLASILLDRGPRKDIDELVRCDQIVEVSCYIILILIDNDERGTNVTIPNS
jgi:protein-histidine N-methyltransferase